MKLHCHSVLWNQKRKRCFDFWLSQPIFCCYSKALPKISNFQTSSNFRIDFASEFLLLLNYPFYLYLTLLGSHFPSVLHLCEHRLQSLCKVPCIHTHTHTLKWTSHKHFWEEPISLKFCGKQSGFHRGAAHPFSSQDSLIRTHFLLFVNCHSEVILKSLYYVELSDFLNYAWQDSRHDFSLSKTQCLC